MPRPRRAGARHRLGGADRQLISVAAEGPLWQTAFLTYRVPYSYRERSGSQSARVPAGLWCRARPHRPAKPSPLPRRPMVMWLASAVVPKFLTTSASTGAPRFSAISRSPYQVQAALLGDDEASPRRQKGPLALWPAAGSTARASNRSRRLSRGTMSPRSLLPGRWHRLA